MKTRITIQHIQSRQSVVRGPVIYRSILTFGKWEDGEFKPDKVPEQIVRNNYVRLVNDWYEKPEWFQPFLKELTYRGAGEWYVEIHEPYTD